MAVVELEASIEGRIAESAQRAETKSASREEPQEQLHGTKGRIALGAQQAEAKAVPDFYGTNMCVRRGPHCEGSEALQRLRAELHGEAVQTAARARAGPSASEQP